ncbi:MAG TPA: Ig-like domain-containing protein [Candidatus Kapabacteria bacterium]|nr:Ig-like domain-containing protein [Candidatus Kapabacteria bacterium]
MVSCANIQPPSGGPEDKEPPQIIETIPANNSTNYNEAIIINFDKYMDRNKVIENINIIPDAKIETNWNGKELTLTFKEKLLENTTYSVNLGTEYTDNHGNKPNSSFSIVFSSGANIDSGFIAGHLVSTKAQGKYIFCYSKAHHNFDALNYHTTKADYKIQIGANGDFIIPGLKDGVYRIIAVDDILKNGLIDQNDPFSTAYKDFEVHNSKSDFVIIKDGIAIDKTLPAIFSINSIYSNVLNIRFTKKMNDSSVYNSSLIIYDSTGKEVSSSKHSIKNIQQDNSYNYLLSGALDSSMKLLSLKFDKMKLPLDSAYNSLDTNKASKFAPRTKIDTSALLLIAKPFADSANAISISPEFPFTFNSFIDKSAAKVNYKLIGTVSRAEIPLSIIDTSENIYLFKPKSSLKEKTGYQLSIDFKNLINLSSKKSIDTNIILTFASEDRGNLGSVSGHLISHTLSCNDNLYMLLSSKDKMYKIEINKDNTFEAKDLVSDEYQIEIFCDENLNTIYDFGQLVPYKFSEKFYIHSKTLKIKAKWSVDNFIIEEGK